MSLKYETRKFFSSNICYTFSAIVIKYIAEVDLMTAICVQAFTNFFGCYVGMQLADWYTKNK